MVRKSAEEVWINPEGYSGEDEETFYNVKFSMDESYSLSDEQRKEILEILLMSSKKGQEESAEENIPTNSQESFSTLIVLVLGFVLGAFFFFILSMI